MELLVVIFGIILAYVLARLNYFEKNFKLIHDQLEKRGLLKKREK